MLSRVETTMQNGAKHVCKSMCPKQFNSKHFFNFIFKISPLSHIKTFSFLYFKSSPLLVQTSNFNPIFILQYSLGCCFNSHIHVPKIIFHQ